jgi:hypothetical protein
MKPPSYRNMIYGKLIMKAEDIQYEKEFDAIWACASLLHVSFSGIASGSKIR